MADSPNEVKAPAQKQEQKLPLNFGKRLAHTDKHIRDRGFKILKRWFQKHPELERLDYMKIWKGLFYGMWMSDKRPVQQELSVNIALLINDVPREKQVLWIETFWETMKASWEKMDKHRMNKYMLFVRIVVAEWYKVVREGGWTSDQVPEVVGLFVRGVPNKARSGYNVPGIGLLVQLCRIFWEELTPQLSQKPKASVETIMTIIEPWCLLADGCAIDALVRSVHEYVLRRTPEEYSPAVAKRVVEGASNPDHEQRNREALYDTADILEQVNGAQRPLEVAMPEPMKTVYPLKPKTKNRKRKGKRKAAAEGDAAKEEAEADAAEGEAEAKAEAEGEAPAAAPARKKRRRKGSVSSKDGEGDAAA